MRPLRRDYESSDRDLRITITLGLTEDITPQFGQLGKSL